MLFGSGASRAARRGARRASAHADAGRSVSALVPFAFPLHGAPHDFRRWTAPGLVLELREAGYVVEEIVPCGGTFAAATLNILLVLRYSIPGRGSIPAAIITLLLPVFLVLQGVLNGAALALDHPDKDKRLPISFVAIGRAA